MENPKAHLRVASM